MINAQTAKLRPNLLAQTIEQEEENRRIENRVFRDSTNQRQRNPRRGKTIQIESATPKEAQESKHASEAPHQESLQRENSKPIPKPNFLIQFDSDEDERQGQNHLQQAKAQCNEQSKTNIKGDNISLPQRKSFLLAFQSDNQQEGQPSKLEEKYENQPQNLQRKQTGNTSERLSKQHGTNPIKPQFLLDFDEQNSVSENQLEEFVNSQKCENNQSPTLRKVAISLNYLLKEFRDRYHLQPIPRGRVFECVVKRDRNEQITKYHVYDNINLRNFITIIKDDDGYLVISKYEVISSKNLNEPVRKERVIGRITSNFFGTEFNCMVESTPYKYGKEYPADAKKERIMTVQYETNFFGMKGPRKMKAFMTEGCGIMGKGLNQVYEKQKNLEKSRKRVLAFKNKTPRWCREVGSYVLNFNGRASISSVKNFLMIGQHQNDQAVPKVLFGKFGKQLFNLDIRYPFNLLQGIALAISSFDRKLACE